MLGQVTQMEESSTLFPSTRSQTGGRFDGSCIHLASLDGQWSHVYAVGSFSTATKMNLASPTVQGELLSDCSVYYHPTIQSLKICFLVHIGPSGILLAQLHIDHIDKKSMWYPVHGQEFASPHHQGKES